MRSVNGALPRRRVLYAVVLVGALAAGGWLWTAHRHKADDSCGLTDTVVGPPRVDPHPPRLSVTGPLAKAIYLGRSYFPTATVKPLDGDLLAYDSAASGDDTAVGVMTAGSQRRWSKAGGTLLGVAGGRVEAVTARGVALIDPGDGHVLTCIRHPAGLELTSKSVVWSSEQASHGAHSTSISTTPLVSGYRAVQRAKLAGRWRLRAATDSLAVLTSDPSGDRGDRSVAFVPLRGGTGPLARPTTVTYAKPLATDIPNYPSKWAGVEVMGVAGSTTVVLDDYQDTAQGTPVGIDTKGNVVWRSPYRSPAVGGPVGRPETIGFGGGYLLTAFRSEKTLIIHVMNGSTGNQVSTVRIHSPLVGPHSYFDFIAQHGAAWLTVDIGTAYLPFDGTGRYALITPGEPNLSIEPLNTAEWETSSSATCVDYTPAYAPAGGNTASPGPRRSAGGCLVIRAQAR
jgi:hypothetical protein